MISSKDNWRKELGSEIAGGSEDSQQTQPKTKILVKSGQPSSLLTKRIGIDVFFGCESTNSRTVRPVNASSFSQSCVPVSVERSDKDKDTDENVDGDPVRTGGLVSGQPTSHRSKR